MFGDESEDAGLPKTQYKDWGEKKTPRTDKNTEEASQNDAEHERNTTRGSVDKYGKNM